jgi:FkbH-like protein
MAGSKTIKCLVWDLDNTLWDGTLLEDGEVVLREGVLDVIRELDRRGILMSIASKNEPDDALKMLSRLGVSEYFLVPQIGWGAKSGSIEEIARLLNIGLDTFAFIDDQPVEREEVFFHHPEVRVYDASVYRDLPGLPEFTPRFITGDSTRRRLMYQEDQKRKDEEERFGDNSEEFLRTLDMELTISRVKEGDLERAEELTLRTNQLNSTGLTYDYDELRRLIASPKHLFLIAELTDKFGSYGKIGLMLAEKSDAEAPPTLTIKLLLMSCRVMTRGVGSALLIHLTKIARAEGRELLADFVATGRNRIMYITYKLMGFEEVSQDGDRSLLTYKGGEKEYPEYLKVECTR